MEFMKHDIYDKFDFEPNCNINYVPVGIRFALKLLRSILFHFV